MRQGLYFRWVVDSEGAEYERFPVPRFLCQRKGPRQAQAVFQALAGGPARGSPLAGVGTFHQRYFPHLLFDVPLNPRPRKKFEKPQANDLWMSSVPFFL